MLHMFELKLKVRESAIIAFGEVRVNLRLTNQAIRTTNSIVQADRPTSERFSQAFVLASSFVLRTTLR